MRRVALSLLARTGLSIVLIGVLLWRIDVREALSVARHANYLYLLPALPLFTASKLVHAYRWRVMLHQMGKPPLQGLLGIYLVSNMANALFPVRLGDFLRVQVPARRYGLPRAGLTASVFVTESLLDGAAFVVLLLAALALFRIPTLPLTFVWVFAGIVFVGLAATVLLARLRLQEGWVERGPLRHLPERIGRPLSRLAPEFVQGLAVLKDPWWGGQAVLATAAAWLLESLVFYFYGKTFGLSLAFPDYVVLMITANMIVSIPLVPSNVGPYEVAVTGMAALLGASASQAGAFALGGHLINIAWVTASGLVAMWLMGLAPADLLFLRREAKEEQMAIIAPP